MKIIAKCLKNLAWIRNMFSIWLQCSLCKSTNVTSGLRVNHQWLPAGVKKKKYSKKKKVQKKRKYSIC